MLRNTIIILILFSFFSCKTEKEKVKIDGELKKWHKITLSFEADSLSELSEDNPFMDYRLEIEFSNGKKSIKVPGYFAADGNAANTSAQAGKVWKTIFRPEQTGQWKYKISFRKGKNIAIDEKVEGEALPMDAYQGSFTISESDKTGRDFRAKGRIVNGGKGYWKFSDTNELFIKNGADSPEDFLGYYEFDQTIQIQKKKREGEDLSKGLHKYKAHAADFEEGNPVWADGKGKNIIGALNYLSEQGVNSVYMLTMNIQGDGHNVWPYTNENERFRFDCSKLDQWQMVFDYMEQKGMMMHLVLQETENECLLDSGNTDIERKIYFKELSARFGHYLGVIWNLGEENGAADWSPIGQNDQQRKDMANYLKKINPYNPIVMLHTHAGTQRQDLYLNPLLGFKNLDGASMQIGTPKQINARIDTFVRRSAKANKKWLVSLDEIGPYWKGVMPDAYDAAHDTVRNEALWGSLMAGASGVEWYFGYKYPNADLSCEDFRSRHNWWQQSTIATDFISQFPLEEMEAMPQIIKSNNDTHKESNSSFNNVYVLAKAEEIYIVYISRVSEKVKTQLKNAENYELKWFNPRKGGEMLHSEPILNKEKTEIELSNAPADLDKDWVAVLVKKNKQ